MGFTEATATCLRKYFVFSGRAPRSEYWWFFLFKLILTVAAIAVAIWSLYRNEDLLQVLVIVFVIGYLFLLIPSVAVAVRRLHDWDMSGWVYLVVFVPSIGGLILLGMMIPGSSPGENQYGPHPFDRINTTVFD